MRKRLPLALLLLAGLSGCSAQQLYDTGQAWRRSLCDKAIGDHRSQCLAEARQSYADHRQETDAAR